MKKHILLQVIALSLVIFYCSCVLAEKEGLILIEEETISVAAIESRQGAADIGKWEVEQALAGKGKQVIDHELAATLMKENSNGAEFEMGSEDYKKVQELIKKHKLDNDLSLAQVGSEVRKFKVVYDPKLKDIIAVEKRVNAVEDVKIVFSIPKNEQEYQNIFKEYSEKNLEGMQDIVASLDFSKIGDAHSRDAFLGLLASARNDEPIILIGHNENGLFYFPDGSSALLTDLDRTANANNKRIIILSCNAGKYLTVGPKNALTYEDSMEIAYLMAEKAKIDHFSLMAADDVIKDFESDLTFERRIAAISKITATSTGAGGVIVVTLPDHKPKRRTA